MATITVNRMVFGSKAEMACVGFLMDTAGKPLYTHVDMQGRVTTSDAFDASKPINVATTVSGPLLSTKFIDILVQVTGSKDIYFEPMAAEAERQAMTKGHVINWV